MNHPYSPADEDDDDFDHVSLESEPAGSVSAAAAQSFPSPTASLANPVIRSFDSPAQPAANTVPQAASGQQFPAPSAPSAPQPVQIAPPTQPVAPQPASAVAADENDSTSSTPAAPRSEQDMLADYWAKKQADLHFHKANGGQTEVLSTGYEVPKRDEAGNSLFHPAVVQPFARRPDGTAIRVSRDEYNNHHEFNLADGVEGQDYHVDPQTGEKWVPVSGADGGSKREVIGQDPLVPQINTLKSQFQQHTATTQQANLDISRAINGVQGGGELAAASLTDLREQAGQISKDLAPLKQQLADTRSYAPDGDEGAENPADVQAREQIQHQVDFKQKRLDQVQGEVDVRDSIIADAKQRRDAVTQAKLDTSRKINVLTAARYGRGNIAADLATVATGGAIDSARSDLLTNAGLLIQSQEPDGTTAMHVTREAAGLLDPQLRQQIAADPTSFRVRQEGNPDAAPVVKQVQRALTKTDASQADDNAPRPQSPAQLRQAWQTTQAAILTMYPKIGVAGSPENVAFVRAFRASGGNAQKAVEAVYRR